jgi:colicin import membrane protein
MERKSDSETKALDLQSKGQAEAKRVCDEAWKRAYQAYKEAKEQVDIVHKQASKIAITKEAKKAADEAHKIAGEQAKKVRDAIVAEAMAVFRCSYDQATADYLETTTMTQKAIKDAEETFKEAKKQAELTYKDAKKVAADKEAKKAADEAFKKALEQAKQARDEATSKLR